MWQVILCMYYFLNFKRDEEMGTKVGTVYEWKPSIMPIFSRRSARICKHLRSPGTNSKESILPAYVARRAGAITLFVVQVLARHATYAGRIDSWAP